MFLKKYSTYFVIFFITQNFFYKPRLVLVFNFFVFTLSVRHDNFFFDGCHSTGTIEISVSKSFLFESIKAFRTNIFLLASLMRNNSKLWILTPKTS